MEVRLEPKHPLAIRWFHWVNFPLLALMIWSGVLIYWAYPAVVKLDADTWRALRINNRLAEGMALHFFFMWLFALNGMLYVAYTAVSGEWRELVPRRGTLREAWDVFLHDLHVRRGALPRRKFNGAQRIAYTAVVLMGSGSLLSGLAIYKPVQFAWLVALMGGYQGARLVHFWLTVGYVAFFVVHLAQVVRAGWNNFRAMVIGVEVSDAEVVPREAIAAQTPDEESADEVRTDEELTDEVPPDEAPPDVDVADGEVTDER